LTDNDNGYIAPFLDESSASALRAASLREAGFAPEGLTAVGLENSLVEHVRGDLVVAVKSASA
jgi:hypothetical protein